MFLWAGGGGGGARVEGIILLFSLIGVLNNKQENGQVGHLTEGGDPLRKYSVHGYLKIFLHSKKIFFPKLKAKVLPFCFKTF